MAENQARPPLNQIYKEDLTKRTYPLVDETFNSIRDLSLSQNFVTETGKPKGRIYDDAVLYTAVIEDGGSFEGKVVCDVGARDGIFGSWLTREAAKVYVSDYFELWGKGTEHDLGQIEQWTNIWTSAAPNPDRLVCEHQDMTNLTYDDEMFDITISTSVIEHIFPQANYRGDMFAIREMVRVTKPGGYVLLTTDMIDGPSQWYAGTYYYDSNDIFDRIINPSRCELVGTYDFNFGSSDNTDEFDRPNVGLVSSVIIVLKKPSN